jgi:septum formation inhibitor MinC
MIDPLTLFLVGGGVLAFREFNKKDYGVLSPSRDERYRNAMEHLHQPELLMQEAKLFADHGLKAQAAMLKRRAEWRARPQALKDAHEEVYKKAIGSKNIAPILEVAAAFEGWTATKKAANLRERARLLQEEALQESAQKAAESVRAEEKADAASVAPKEVAKEVAKEEPKHTNGTNGAGIPRNTEPFTGVVDTTGDDT